MFLCIMNKNNGIMNTDTKIKKPERKSVFLKMIECIRMGGDLGKLAKERGLKFAKPL